MIQPVVTPAAAWHASLPDLRPVCTFCLIDPGRVYNSTLRLRRQQDCFEHCQENPDRSGQHVSDGQVSVTLDHTAVYADTYCVYCGQSGGVPIIEGVANIADVQWE